MSMNKEDDELLSTFVKKSSEFKQINPVGWDG
jgi:hypothetical protein